MVREYPTQSSKLLQLVIAYSQRDIKLFKLSQANGLGPIKKVR